MKLGNILENAFVYNSFDNLYFFVEYCLNNKHIESDTVDVLFYWMNMFKVSKTIILKERLKMYIKLFLMNVYDKESFKLLVESFNEKEFDLNEYNDLVDCLKYKINYFYPKIEFIEMNNKIYVMDNGAFYDFDTNKVLFNHIFDYKVVGNKMFFNSNGLFITYNSKYKKMKVLNYEYPLCFFDDFYLAKRNNHLYLLDYNHKIKDKIKIDNEMNFLKNLDGITIYKELENSFEIKCYCLSNHEFIRINKDSFIENQIVWNKFIDSLLDYRKVNRNDQNKTIVNLIILYLLEHIKMNEITLKEIDYLYYHGEHLLINVKILDEIYDNYKYEPGDTVVDREVLFKHVRMADK